MKQADYSPVAHLIKWPRTKVNIYCKILNIGTPEIFAVIYLKVKQRGQTLEYFVKMMPMEQHTVKPWSDCSSGLGAVWSGSTLFVKSYLSKNLRLLR